MTSASNITVSRQISLWCADLTVRSLEGPCGVIKAFEMARKEEECTLVLVGNVATDDPEGAEVYRSLLSHRGERVIILSVQDGALVNALQRRAAVVLQKSIREGFGMTVSEAMWKGAALIGGNVGGIRYQIRDGETGFLVSSVDEAAKRIVQLLRDPDLRKQLGHAARERVRENFLITRTVEQYLDLIASFEPEFRLKQDVGLPCGDRGRTAGVSPFANLCSRRPVALPVSSTSGARSRGSRPPGFPLVSSIWACCTAKAPDRFRNVSARAFGDHAPNALLLSRMRCAPSRGE